eukprot:m.31669 g.31669  ORF g.31669 m.31669 type:complete len:837 (+) comp12091_c0_seq1:100-2610(+)
MTVHGPEVERTVELSTSSREIRQFLCNAAAEWSQTLGAKFCVELATLGHAIITMDQSRCKVRDLLEALTIETNDIRRKHRHSVEVFDDDLDSALDEERGKTAQLFVDLEHTLNETIPQIADAQARESHGLEVANQARQLRMTALQAYTQSSTALNEAVVQRATHLEELAKLQDEIRHLQQEKERHDLQTATLLEDTRNARSAALLKEKQLGVEADSLQETTENLKQKNDRIRNHIVARCRELEHMLSSISHDADLLEHEQLPLLDQRKELDDLSVELTVHIQELRKQKASTQQGIDKAQRDQVRAQELHTQRLAELSQAQEHCMFETEKHDREAADLRRSCKGLERRLVEAEAEAGRRRRVLDGLNTRVEEAQAEMTETTDAIAEMAIQAMAIEGELKTRQEDHDAIMMATQAKKSELEGLLTAATADGKALDLDLHTTQKETEVLRKDLDLGQDRLEREREALTIQIKTIERNLPLLSDSIQKALAERRAIEISLPLHVARNQQNREAAVARLKRIRHKTHQLQLDTTRMIHEDELLEGPIEVLSQDADKAKAACRAIEQELEQIKAEVISRRATHEALTNQLTKAQQPNIKAKARLKQALVDQRDLEHECRETVATWKHRVEQVAARLARVSQVDSQVDAALAMARQDLARCSERLELADYNLEVIQAHQQSLLQDRQESHDSCEDQPRNRRRGSIAIVLSEDTLSTSERLMSPKGYRQAVQGASEQTNDTIEAVSEQARHLEALVTAMHGIAQRMQRAQDTLQLASAQIAGRRATVGSQSARPAVTRSAVRPRLRRPPGTLNRAQSLMMTQGGHRRHEGAASADAVLQRAKRS